MNNKLPALLVSTLAAMFFQVGPVSASPLVSIGDNTDVFFNGSSSLRWSSNIFRNEDDEVDDLIWTVSPGFDVNVGRGLSNADLSIITRYDIIRYQDESRLDTELFHIKAIGSYRSSRLDLSGSVSFDEQKSNSGDNNVRDDLIETDNYAASLNGEYRFSPKLSFGAGVRYSEKEYVGEFADDFADRESITLPFDVFYELTPKMDLSLGYTYSTYDIDDATRSGGTAAAFVVQETSGYEYDSHFFNIGARGNLLPKLTGFFKIGYRFRESDDSSFDRTVFDLTTDPATFTTSTGTTDRNDNGMLGLDADLTWAATPKITARLALSRDFGVGGEGQSTENSSVDLSANYSINSYFSLSGNLGYTLRDFTNGDREDNQYEAGLRLSYRPSQYWGFSAGYTYSENDSDDNLRSYEAHTVDLTATLRY